jgi:hypothetical protein
MESTNSCDGIVLYFKIGHKHLFDSPCILSLFLTHPKLYNICSLNNVAK